MKIIKYIAAILALLFTYMLQGQSINWAKLNAENRQAANLNIGLDYGVVFGAGYSYTTSVKWPVMVVSEVSTPAGSDLFDDFRVKIGAKGQMFRFGDFRIIGNFLSIYRRMQADIVRMDNFGLDVSGVVGYYRPRWFIAADLGFDKAIVTHFKHSNFYRENFPLVQDGWYEPATGGNINYGAQLGYSFQSIDLYFKAGQVIVQDFENKPTLPFYAQLGMTRRF
jgi:hypothetical protein